MANEEEAKDVLANFVLKDNVYVLGSFEKGVTVFNQQVRALNLAWALTKSPNFMKRLEHVAVIGGGIAGLTLAAGLLKKGVQSITIFEKRPVFCPLQQGSDTRWVHPHIYEWPTEGTENPVAGLPIMNWKAGRASDVAQQILDEWHQLKEYNFPNDAKKFSERVTERTDARYIKVNENLEIEWMCGSSDQRSVDGVAHPFNAARETFTSVIFALGFGEENTGDISIDLRPISYWRNESLGQPNLTSARKSYVISGYGDAALIDLCRIRISSFRQDRTLWELFRSLPGIREELEKLKVDTDQGRSDGLYKKLDILINKNNESKAKLLKEVRTRLRADTFAVLAFGSTEERSGGDTEGSFSRHLRHAESFTDVFDGPASFQNKVLLYLLFSVGAFVPAQKSVKEVAEEYNVDKESVIVRHGTKREAVYEEVLTPEAYRQNLSYLKRFFEGKKPQGRVMKWDGGYWDTPLPEFQAIDESLKGEWRQEYLPPATRLICAPFVASLAAWLCNAHPGMESRVTIHRIIRLGDEILLQQACEYYGTAKLERRSAAGRTFSIDRATIGLCVQMKKICRTTPDVQNDAIQKDMNDVLRLQQQSQSMSSDVRSVLTIPFFSASTKEVIGVLYMDSFAPNVFTNEKIKEFVTLCRGFAGMFKNFSHKNINNIAGQADPWKQFDRAKLAKIHEDDLSTIHSVEFSDLEIEPLEIEGTNRLNFEFTEFPFDSD